MADYRVVYTDLKTGDLLGELPVISFGFSEALLGEEDLTAEVALRDSSSMEASDGGGGTEEVAIPQLLTLSSLKVGGTGIYVERDGVLLWGGVLWALQLSVENSTASLSASGMLSYLYRLTIREDLVYSATDQGAIAKALVDYAMGKPGADIGITAATPTASTSRDRTYLGVDRKPVGEAISQLAAVEDGFDFYFEHSWNSGDDGVDTAFTIEANLLGRLTGYVLELGVNVSLLDLSVDGSEMANYAEVMGQGASDVSPANLAFSYDAPSLGSYPLLESFEQDSDITVAATLQARADRNLKRGRLPITRVSLEVFADAIPGLGSYRVGDRVEVRAEYGMVDLDGIYRIVGQDVSVDVTGLETVTLELVEHGVF